jgi:hypothetical protein
MPEIGTSGSMSGDGKRAIGNSLKPAPILDSTRSTRATGRYRAHACDEHLHNEVRSMRTGLFVVALAAASVLSVQSALADVGCVGHRFRFVSNGITHVEGSTRAGQPCQMGFGLAGTDIEALRITVRPSHGILGSSGKEANRRYIAYAPSAGFVGRDRFELLVQFTPVGGASSTTTVKVEMNVTP